MTTVSEIKAAIESLSPRDYCELMAMLHPTVDDDWDRQMTADAASGRLDQLMEQSRADAAAGMCVPLEKVLEDDGSERALCGFPASPLATSGDSIDVCLAMCVAWRQSLIRSGSRTRFIRPSTSRRSATISGQ